MPDLPNKPAHVTLADAIDNAPAVIYLKDEDGRYLYVNKEYEVVSGTLSASALGRNDFELFPPPVAAAYRKDDLKTQEERAPLRFEEPAFVDGNERLFSTMKFPVVSDEGSVGVLGISIDITDQSHGIPGAAAGGQSRADAFFGRLLASLTPQEVRVLDLLVTGLSDREIAEKLALSGDTVRHHVSHVLTKLRKRRAQVIIEMLKRDRE